MAGLGTVAAQGLTALWQGPVCLHLPMRTALSLLTVTFSTPSQLHLQLLLFLKTAREVNSGPLHITPPATHSPLSFQAGSG